MIPGAKQCRESVEEPDGDINSQPYPPPSHPDTGPACHSRGSLNPTQIIQRRESRWQKMVSLSFRYSFSSA